MYLLIVELLSCNPKIRNPMGQLSPLMAHLLPNEDLLNKDDSKPILQLFFCQDQKLAIFLKDRLPKDRQMKIFC